MAGYQHKDTDRQRKKRNRKELPESEHGFFEKKTDKGKSQPETAILKDLLYKYIADNEEDERSFINLLQALLNLESEQKINAYLFSLLNTLKNA